MRKLTLIAAAICCLLLTQCKNSEAQNNKTQTTKDSTMADHTNNPHYSHTDHTHLTVSDTEWKKILTPEVYHIARQKGTEYAFSGKYWKTDVLGTYYCAVCGNPLFKSGAKFASSCGWPSFYESITPTSVRYENDNTHGMRRTEVLCGRCDSHLGHIFDDGPAPSYQRFCMNSAVLEFEPDAEMKDVSEMKK